MRSLSLSVLGACALSSDLLRVGVAEISSDGTSARKIDVQAESAQQPVLQKVDVQVEAAQQPVVQRVDVQAEASQQPVVQKIDVQAESSQQPVVKRVDVQAEAAQQPVVQKERLSAQTSVAETDSNKVEPKGIVLTSVPQNPFGEQPGLARTNPEVMYLLMVALVFTWIWIAVMWAYGYISPAAEEKPRRRSSLHYATGDLALEEEVCNSSVGGRINLAESTLTTFQASQTLFTVMVGAGILALPKVVSTCGWVVGTFSIVAGGTFNVVAALTLVDAIERSARKGSVKSFKDVAFVCFGKYGAMAADACFIVLLFSVCALFVVLIAENLHFLMPRLSTRWWILITGVTCSSTALVNDVSFLAKLAFLGVAASMVYVVCITSGGLAAASMQPDREWTTMPTVSAGQIFSKFCVCLLGFCCSNTLTSIRSSMERPAELPKAITQSHLAAGLVYIGAGCVGYYGWGNQVKGNILESMVIDNGNGQQVKMISGYILAAAVVCNLVVSLPFNCFVLFQTLEAKFPQVQHNAALNSAMRLGAMAVVTVAAMLVPYFMEMLTIIASVFIVAIVLLWPSAFAMKLDYDEGKSPVSTHAVTFICGLAVGMVGLVEAVNDLQLKINETK